MGTLHCHSYYLLINERGTGPMAKLPHQAKISHGCDADRSMCWRWYLDRTRGWIRVLSLSLKVVKQPPSMQARCNERIRFENQGVMRFLVLVHSLDQYWSRHGLYRVATNGNTSIEVEGIQQHQQQFHRVTMSLESNTKYWACILYVFLKKLLLVVVHFIMLHRIFGL